jgi:ABC-type nickel/cobalt efflux system permease component RcnA
LDENDIKASENLQVSWPNLITGLSIIVVVGAQVFVVARSAAWALGGYYQLGYAQGLIVQLALGAVGLYLVWLLWKRIQVIEPLWTERPQNRE